MQMSPLWLTLWLIVVVLLLCLCCAVTVWLLRHRRNMQRDRQTARETMLVLHSELMRRRHEARRAQEEAAEDREEATLEGLESLPVAEMSVMRNSMTERQLQGDEECCLCMEAFQDTDELRVLPCEHFYHKNCIDRWFAARRYQARSCPLCKRNPLQNGEGHAEHAEGVEGMMDDAFFGIELAAATEDGLFAHPASAHASAYSTTSDAASSAAARPAELELQSLSDSDNGQQEQGARRPPPAGAAGEEGAACLSQ
jgi:hypothetical protein